jgi:DNA-binding beta-propeller fold protein YncE
MKAAIRTMIGLGALMLALGLVAPTALGAAGDPLFVYKPPPPEPGSGPKPPPTSRFNGPCGLAVDAVGSFYVSDYYHHVIDAFGFPLFPTKPVYSGQIIGDPEDGPCEIAFNSTGDLYVNDFHRNVIGRGANIDEGHPTGVAIDVTTDRVYVNDRTHVSAYEPSGAPVMEGGEALRIGAGSVQDGYGLAVSAFPATQGFVYVPDAESDTVKVFDPEVDKSNPVKTIQGPFGGFTSLRDGAVAVDKATGNVYVADNLQPLFTERPESAIDVFSPAGGYLGRLKFKVTDALPPGLAVDNSATASQGRVYVTSGNTDEAVIYAYPPESQVSSTLPATQSVSIDFTGSGDGQVTSAEVPRLDCAATCETEVLNGTELTLIPEADPGSRFAGWSGGGCGGSGECTLGIAQAAALEARFEPVGNAGAPAQRRGGADSHSIAQKGTLRLSLSGRLSPRKLPRKGPVPIAVSVGADIATTDGSPPPKLTTLAVEINRHGSIDNAGLPTCPYPKIQPATSQRALANCRSALVGEGAVEAEVALSSQEPYLTKGRLLLFNGERHGKPVIFGQIFSPHPFATSFVIIFSLKQLKGAEYGTELAATLPKALSSWGNLTGIEMTLSRRYTYQGERHSFISGVCPAPDGFTKAVFPLAKASFGFKTAGTIGSTLTGTCETRG